jgi:hypothetical protein
MTPGQLEGLWINGHIRELLAEKSAGGKRGPPGNGNAAAVGTGPAAPLDPAARALRDVLEHAEKVVEAARLALNSYVDSRSGFVSTAGDGMLSSASGGRTRRGPTSRELSGEMGGDTVVVA